MHIQYQIVDNRFVYMDLTISLNIEWSCNIMGHHVTEMHSDIEGNNSKERITKENKVDNSSISKVWEIKYRMRNRVIIMFSSLSNLTITKSST